MGCWRYACHSLQVNQIVTACLGASSRRRADMNMTVVCIRIFTEFFVDVKTGHALQYRAHTKHCLQGQVQAARRTTQVEPDRQAWRSLARLVAIGMNVTVRCYTGGILATGPLLRVGFGCHGWSGQCPRRRCGDSRRLNKWCDACTTTTATTTTSCDDCCTSTGAGVSVRVGACSLASRCPGRLRRCLYHLRRHSRQSLDQHRVLGRHDDGQWKVGSTGLSQQRLRPHSSGCASGIALNSADERKSSDRHASLESH